MKIKSIRKVPYSGTVYNLGVEEDESYIANGIIVHNCRCVFVPITSVEVDREVKSGSGIEVSSHRLPVGFPDEGFKKFDREYADEIKVVSINKLPIKVVVTEKTWKDILGEKKVVKSEEPKVKIIEKVIVPDSEELRKIRDEVVKQGELVKALQLDIMEKSRHIDRLEGGIKVARMEEVSKLEEQVKVLSVGMDKLRNDLELRKLDQVVAPEKQVEGYEWVVRCPYRMCGSSDFKPVKSLEGAVIYRCDHCNHLFKVLQEGETYLYDVGKEEWASADMSIRPCYFVAEVEGKRYEFDTKEEIDSKLEEGTKYGLDKSKVEIIKVGG